MELELRQEQQLSMRQLHSLRLLQMGRLEMREYLETVAQENPTVELELPHEEEPLTRQAERWLDRWRWLEENDRQNSYYERPNQEEEDSPMNRIGTDGGLAETLESFLCRQIAGLEVPERQRQLLYYLVGCLEDSGYLTTPPEELAVGAGVPEEELRRSIARLQTLEPAGVGAADLSQCLYLQLQRIGDDGPATQIVLHHLEALAKNRYHQIAQTLHISQEEVPGPAAHPAAGSPAGAAVQSAGAGPHGVPGCVRGGAGGGVRLRRPPASGSHAAPEPVLSGSVPPDG